MADRPPWPGLKTRRRSPFAKQATFHLDPLAQRPILTGGHCVDCTATGNACGGAIAVGRSPVTEPRIRSLSKATAPIAGIHLQAWCLGEEQR